MSRNIKFLYPMFLVIVIASGCGDDFEVITPIEGSLDKVNYSLADKNADVVVDGLRTRLIEVGEQGVAFGHQDATAYGVNWEHSGFPSNSDVERVCGDFPAVIGFDIGEIERGRPNNLDGIPFSLMKDLIIEAHEAGSIVTISWHASNPITRGTTWHISGDIASILPGGDAFPRLERYVDRAAAFLSDLVDSNGNPIPIIFRPWHEMNGDWFWWGSEILTPDEYKVLYQTTVDLLVNQNDVHNLLFCYSPNSGSTKQSYLEHYPGDEYVDMLGVDVYDFRDEEYIPTAEACLTTIANLGYEKNKPFAFTETGLENILESNWWTEKLYPCLLYTSPSPRDRG